MQRKHIEELIDELTFGFLECYKLGDSRPAVADYGARFMGSIVLAGRKNAMIDGQQRFSSLTLLLMYLNNHQKANGQSYNRIETMIFSESFGTKSFNKGDETFIKAWLRAHYAETIRDTKAGAVNKGDRL